MLDCDCGRLRSYGYDQNFLHAIAFSHCYWRQHIHTIHTYIIHYIISIFINIDKTCERTDHTNDTFARVCHTRNAHAYTYTHIHKYTAATYTFKHKQQPWEFSHDSSTAIFAIDRSNPMISRTPSPSWWSICVFHVLLNRRESSWPRKIRTQWHLSNTL